MELEVSSSFFKHLDLPISNFELFLQIFLGICLVEIVDVDVKENVPSGLVLLALPIRIVGLDNIAQDMLVNTIKLKTLITTIIMTLMAD